MEELEDTTYYVIIKIHNGQIAVAERDFEDYEVYDTSNLVVNKRYRDQKEVYRALRKLYDAASPEQRTLFFDNMEKDTREKMFFLELQEQAKELLGEDD